MREWKRPNDIFDGDMKKRLILASASPRRRELLGSLGLDFAVENSGVPEDTVDYRSPADFALELARQKAEAVAARYPEAIVLGADTVVVVGSDILGKPADGEDARRMLALIRNRWHLVITGLAVVAAHEGKTAVRHVETGVRMADYSKEAVEAYIASGEPLDKAGSYAIQGLGSKLVAGIEGCYTNVVGLPLCEVSEVLRDFGIEVPAATDLCTDSGGQPCPRLA